MSASDKFSNKADDLAGKAKEGFGKATRDQQNVPPRFCWGDREQHRSEHSSQQRHARQEKDKTPLTSETINGGLEYL